MERRYRFGPWEVQADQRTVLREGQPVSLGSRAFDVLLQLLRQRGRVVSKSELLDTVWTDLVVEESNVQVQRSALRKEFGAGVIATIPGRGYRFVAPLLDEDLLAAAVTDGAATGSVAMGDHNLPLAPDPLIGREADLAWLIDALLRGRLVTVLGPGGIGKTRVALQVSRLLPTAFAHGRWWVDLAAVTTLRQAIVAIANAAQVQLAGAEADSTDLLLGLSARHTLLVLDNCEHLAADLGPLVMALLARAPALRMLATSQESLKVAGGVDYRLGPLELADPGAGLEQARACSALRLLECRAQAVDHRFSLSHDNLAQAIALARHLDGNALAIEMAAARIPMLGLQRLSQSLDERFQLLRRTARDGAQRQQTLLATLAWSDSLLDETERRRLQALSAFVGSFRVDVAQAVLADGPEPSWAALDTVSALVDKSLVQLDSLEPPRYKLLETVRLYMLAGLRQRGGQAQAFLQHGRALAALGEQAEHDYWALGDADWLARHAPDYDDLQVAFDRACDRRDVDSAASTGAALMRLDHLRNVNPSRRQRAEALHALLPLASPRARATIWNCIASHGLIALDVVSRVEAARQAVDAWRPIADPMRLHFALGFLAVEMARAQDFAGAEVLLDECRALERPDWPLRRLMWGAAAAAGVSIHRGDAQRYRAESMRELALAEQAGAVRAAAWARLKLADAALMAGDCDQAVALGEAAVHSLRALDQPSNLGLALSNLCAARLLSGDDDRARQTAAEALPLMARGGWGHLLADSVALLAARTGQMAMAAQLLGHAQAWYARHGDERQPNEAVLAGQTRALAEADLGPAGFAHRLRQGEALDAAAAQALAAGLLQPAASGRPAPT